jgi:hypothetical protein
MQKTFMHFPVYHKSLELCVAEGNMAVCNIYMKYFISSTHTM